MRIVIFTQSPFSKSPRVVKEANFLATAGYDVSIFGLVYNEHILNIDRLLVNNEVSLHYGINLIQSNIVNKLTRIKRRLFRELVCFGVHSRHALGYDFNGYLKKLKSENADLYIGHEEMSLALAKELILDGRKVAFDFEDYHSHDLLPKDCKYRPIHLLMNLESFILKNAVYTSTTSDSLAKELANTYNSPIPKTIYNSFKRQYKTIEIIQNATPTLVWISQIIGPGRGLELLIESISKSQLRYKLTLIGKKDENYCRRLILKNPYNLEIEFADYIPVQEIANYLCQFDVGIAFEEFEPLNKDLTISNKIFHYLNAGIGVLATNTKGQKELKEKAGTAMEMVSSNSLDIAKKLDEIFSKENKLNEMKKMSRYIGSTEFCFTREEIKIKLLVESVFK
jgi:glycosyltransferase involved in cell wall biosynthesis